MSNSPLVSYTRWSPNHSGARNQRITKITPHHMAGNLSVETCGSVFASPAREASSNYGIGTDGRIGLYVDEANRAWTSASPWNDNRAVTIEVANDKLAPEWSVSQKAWDALVDLCVDIVRRNPGITRKDGKTPGLWYDGTRDGSLTNHDMFAATNCCGPYLKARMQRLCDEVNAKLDGKAPAASKPAETPKPAAKPAAKPSAPAPAEIAYRVRTGGKWLAEMIGHKDTGGSSDAFAGNGQAIEYLAMKFPGWYQVKTQRSGWLPKVTGYDINDLDKGCAGDGSPITAVRCYYETLDPGATGYYAIEYAVAPVGRGFYGAMIDLADTGGSGDDYAGNGSAAIGKFRARLVKAS